MKITLKLYASLGQYLPVAARRDNRLELEIDPDTPIDTVIARFGLPANQVKLVLVDGHYVPPELRSSRVLIEGDTLAIWPPIAGG
jgi:sulfur carrier protein ThiS